MLYSLSVFLLAFIYIVIRPLRLYYRDPKSLRRLPNASPLSGISNVWFAWEAWKGTRYSTLKELHLNSPQGRQSILRIGPNFLSFIEPQAVKDIHGHGTALEKGEHYDLIAGTHRHLADVTDRGEHARKRKVLAAAFTASSIDEYEYILTPMMASFIAQFDKRCCIGPPGQGARGGSSCPVIDYRRWAILYSQEAITALGLSENLGFLETGDDLTTAERANGELYQAHFRDSIEGGMHRDCVLIVLPTWYKTLQTWACTLLPTYRAYSKRGDAFSDICRHLTRKRIRRAEKGETPHDFFTALLQSRDGNPNNYPFGELFAEANVILNAGSDSTGIAMTNTLIALLENPATLAALREELDAALDDEDDVVAPYRKIRYLPYLRAVIDESMRITPPSAFSLPRKTPPEGACIDGHWIAGNVQVSTATQAIHMDPSIWGDPEVFRPERWLGEGAKHLQQHFQTFTIGPRGCIGRNVTYLEQYVMLASFVRRYGFCLAGGEGWTAKRYETVVVLVDELPLHVWRR